MIVCGSLHPAFILRSRGSESKGEARFKQTVFDDFRKAVSYLWRRPSWDERAIWERDALGRLVNIFPTVEDVRRFFERTKNLAIAVDVETTGIEPLDCKLMCIGMATREGHAICVPVLRKGGLAYWSPRDWSHVYAYVWQILADVRRPKIFHNGPYDSVVLQSGGFQLSNWEDSLISHHCFDAELPHSLAYCTSRYLELPYYKDDVKGGEKWLEMDDATLRIYNQRDALATARLMPIFEGEIRKYGLGKLYNQELQLAKVMVRATQRGLYVDQARRQTLKEKLTFTRDTSLAELRKLAGDPEFNPNSVAIQVRKFLYETMKFPVVRKTDKGAPSTDKEAMVLLSLHAETAEQKMALKNLISWRRAAKALGTWIEGLHVLADGRFHPTWKVYGTVSGRQSSTPGAQNWTDEVKSMFCAPEGRCLVGVDLSQAELRAIAYMSGDEELLLMYERGMNVHTINATLLFQLKNPGVDTNDATEEYLVEACQRLLNIEYAGLPVAPANRWKRIRRLAKTGVFACLDKDTPVAVLDMRGRVPICNVRPGDWTWCWDGGRYVKTQVKYVVCHGVRPAVRVMMRDGANKLKSVVVTPDHRMLLRDGTYKAAGELICGDRLMPFRRYTMKTGYREMDPTNTGSRVYEHRWVMFGNNHKNSKLVPHHSDHVRNNNVPSNLSAMTHSMHRSEHFVPLPFEVRSEISKRMWSQSRMEMLAEARRNSPKFMAHASALGKKWAAANLISTRERQKSEASKKSCSQCGSKPYFARGLCQRCYHRAYRVGALPNHVVVSVEPCGDKEVWDLEVDHLAHNFAIDGAVFVSNCNYGAIAETVHAKLRAERDPKTDELLFADLTLGDVEALKATWEMLHPRIVQWWADVVEDTMSRGFYQCPLSERIRWFRAGFDRNEMLNFPIQTLVAAWMNQCTLEIDERFQREAPSAQIVSQVHDFLGVECATQEADTVGSIMMEQLSQTFSLPGYPKATLPPDKYKIGKYLDEI